jgi:hypothetical protein
MKKLYILKNEEFGNKFAIIDETLRRGNNFENRVDTHSKVKGRFSEKNLFQVSDKFSTKSIKSIENLDNLGEEVLDEIQRKIKGRSNISWSPLFILNSCGLSFCIKKDINFHYFEYGNDLLQHDLNIVQILKKLMHYESFLKILLDEDFIHAMKLIHSRQIDLEKKASEKISQLKNMFDYNDSDKENAVQIIRGLENCMRLKSMKKQRLQLLL